MRYTPERADSSTVADEETAVPKPKRNQRRYKPRKRLNLSESTAVAYLIQFEVKLPAGVPGGGGYARRESPPTLDEGEARDAYRDLLTKAEQIGIRNPRLIERTVTDRILADRDASRAEDMASRMREELESRGYSEAPTP